MYRFITYTFLLFICIFLSAAHAQAQTLAFPGAEGFGKYAKGGRGGQVIEVTNLNDSGSGSFRACVEASGPRTCVFRTGGIIKLKSRIIITKPYLTIAGQTAPGDGITIRNDPSFKSTSISIDTNEVIVRHIRIRPGTSVDALNVRNGAKNVIIDHVSATWAGDETISASNSSDFTLQWSMVAEPLNCYNHPENYCHGFGTLLSSGSSNLSVHHNLYAHTQARAPQVDTSTGIVDIVNNLIYNAAGQSDSWGPSHIKSGKPNYINNFLKAGPDTVHNFYVSGGTPYMLGTEVPTGFKESSSSQASSPYSVPQAYQVKSTSAQIAYDDILAGAGSTGFLTCDGTLIFRRDLVDTRIVNDVQNGSGEIVCNTFTGKEHDSSFNGNCKEGVDFVYPALAAGTACTDSDHDGMPNVWELANGFNPYNDADGAQDSDGNGYTNLEEYLNSSSGNNAPPDDSDPPAQPQNLRLVATN